MTTEHSDPPQEQTDQRADVLSDATDLDALLDAILGDEAAPLPTQGQQPDEPNGTSVAAGERYHRPAVVVSPLAEVDRAHASELDATAHEPAEWGFVSEDRDDGTQTAHDVRPVPQNAPASVVLPFSPRAWRDKLRVALSKRSLIVAALTASALIIASAISLRGARTETVTAPSADAPAPVQAASPVESPSAGKAAGPSEVEVWAAAREPKEPPRVTSRTRPRRPNEVTDQRPPPIPKPVIVEAPRIALSASPPVASPAAVERISAPTDRDAATGRTAIPEGAKPRLTDSESTDAAPGPRVTNVAESAPTAAAAAVPARVPRRTAPKLLIGSAPEYPAALRTAKIGGSVEVRFTIDSSGRVINVQSVSGPLQLRAAAEAAVRRWRYEAARLDNLAVETQTSIRFNFDPSSTPRPKE